MLGRILIYRAVILVVTGEAFRPRTFIPLAVVALAAYGSFHWIVTSYVTEYLQDGVAAERPHKAYGNGRNLPVRSSQVLRERDPGESFAEINRAR